MARPQMRLNLKPVIPWLAGLIAAYPAGGQTPPALTRLEGSDTVAVAKLTPPEQARIFAEVGRVSFDTPASWPRELRIRRVPLGAVQGLVAQGTDLLCGGTGNCQTVVLRRANGTWKTMFRDQAPIGNGFGFLQQGPRGIPDFVIRTHLSAASAKYVVYRFDGTWYRPSRCYEENDDQRREVPCK